MVEKIYENPDVYKIFVELPENPLKYLNCYVIKDGGESLIIDTGFRREECIEAFKKGLKELDVDIDKSILFLTHLHSDHTGMVTDVITENTRVIMGSLDYEYLRRYVERDQVAWKNSDERFFREGLSRELIEEQQRVNPARYYALKDMFAAETVEDGHKISVGSYTLKCVWTPGHTPGHMCLYMEKEKILFSGDHILFDITPNITSWGGVEDSLGNYLESLKKTRELEIETCFPAHRKNEMCVYERIQQIQKHHDFRIAQTLSIITETPGLTAYQIGAGLSWSMRGRNWEEFPIQQKWFAMGETIAHIDYLRLRGKVDKREADGIFRYYPI
ncbi:MAG: MBL fold metallo-hydrolase [Clostridiales bacterium]|nr:MBL fold metallo-hydrolase [Clostridiales bacterium]